MRATIKDVAKAAGVSPATVSLVLNNRKASISQETRTRVLEAAQNLSYRPNQSAVALSSRKTNTIGVIIPDTSNTFHCAFCDQIETAAEAKSYSTIIRIAHNGCKDTLRFLCDLEDRGLDGIILTKSQFKDPEETAACLEQIAGLQTPVMLADRVPEQVTHDAILMNDYLGGRIATEHLLSLGHTKIGCMTASLYYQNSSLRLKGYRDALEERGIPYDPSIVLEAGDWNIGKSRQYLPRFMGQGVTAIFAFNDVMAYEIYREARRYDVRIPDDISIIGFDNLLYSDVVSPPLTSLEYPIRSMAESLVNELLLKIADPGYISDLIVFDPILMLKNSTARPKTKA